MSDNLGDAPLPQRSPTPDPREQSTKRLLSLLELAEKPSRTIDAEIARATGYKQAGLSCDVPLWWDPAGKYVGMTPRFTESLDAALTLVPPGRHAAHDRPRPPYRCFVLSLLPLRG